MASVDEAGKPYADLQEPCTCGHVRADHGNDQYRDEVFLPCDVAGCDCADFEGAYQEEP